MKKNVKYSILAAIMIACFGMGACSSKPEVVQEKRPEMPADYPKTSGPVLKNLANAIPGDTEWIGFSSFGTITELIPFAETKARLDHESTQNTLKDLGTHYRLMPSKLRDYYNAGLNTGSGFAAGFRDGNLFFVLDVLDKDLFDDWLKNFINEEFGRPVTQETSENGRTFTEINVMHKDFGTLVAVDKHTVLLVMGPQLFPTSHPSLESAKAFLSQPVMSSNDIDEIIKQCNDGRLSVWAASHTSALDSLPASPAGFIREWVDSATLNFSIQEDKIKLQSVIKYGKTPYQEKDRGSFVSELLPGTKGTHDARIYTPDLPITLRISPNTKLLESLIIPKIDAKSRNSYNSIKDKLTQKIFNLDISKQIIYNIDSIWLSVLPDEDNNIPNENTSVINNLLSKSIVISIPFKEVSDSESFFSKLNMFKRFIPENMATVEQSNDILHAVISMGPNKLHAAYKQGLMTISTDRAWPAIQNNIMTNKLSKLDPPFNQTSRFLAFHLDSVKAIEWLNGIDTTYAKQLKSISSYFKTLDITVLVENSQLTVDALF